MSSTAKPNPKEAETHAKQGSIYAKQQQWQSAVESYRRAIELNPNSSWFYHNLGEGLFQLGKWQEAAEIYRRAIELNPNFSWSYYNLGKALIELQEWQEAVAVYRRAVELNPDFPWSYYELGNALLKLQKNPEAVAAILNAVILEQKFPEIYHKLGDALGEIAASDLEAAINYYRQIVKNPEAEPLYFKLIESLKDTPKLALEIGKGLAKENKIKAAIIFYNIAKEIQPDNAAIIRELEKVLEKKNNLEKDIAARRQQIENKPNAASYYHLGIALSREQKWEEAAVAYRSAFEIKPDFRWWFYYNSWEAFIKVGNLQEIEDFFLEFLRDNPQSFWAYLNVGEALTRQGKTAEATLYYQSACYQQTLTSNSEFVKKYWEIGKLTGPEFVIIGVHKGGTTSLYAYLIQHPQVIAPIKKEMDFWSWKFNGSVDWYRSHFSPIPEQGNFLTGEASPSYFDYREVPTRLFNAFPKIKLILLLRNPVDRAVSQYHHWKRLNWENRSLEEAFNSDLEKLIVGKIDVWRKDLNYLARGVYVEFVREWLRVFPREQLLILKSEDFYQNTVASMEKVFAFLGLPMHHLPEYTTWNPGTYSPISESMRHRLNDFFRPHNQGLEEYLGMKFNWDN